MVHLLMVLLLNCPETVIKNYSDEPVNEKLLVQATKTCQANYGKCLKLLIKKKDKHHYAICGKGN